MVEPEAVVVPAGDALLTRLGKDLTRFMAGQGTAYRMGGDEFCALIRREPGTVAALQAASVASSLADSGSGWKVSASHGVVALPQERRVLHVGHEVRGGKRLGQLEVGLEVGEQIQRAELAVRQVVASERQEEAIPAIRAEQRRRGDVAGFVLECGEFYSGYRNQ